MVRADIAPEGTLTQDSWLLSQWLSTKLFPKNSNHMRISKLWKPMVSTVLISNSAACILTEGRSSAKCSYHKIITIEMGGNFGRWCVSLRPWWFHNILVPKYNFSHVNYVSTKSFFFKITYTPKVKSVN